MFINPLLPFAFFALIMCASRNFSLRFAVRLLRDVRK